MDMNALPSFVLSLVLIGLILGVGLVTFSNMSTIAQDSTTAYYENHTGVTSNLITLDNSNVTSVDLFCNEKNITQCSNTTGFKYPAEWNWTEGSDGVTTVSFSNGTFDGTSSYLTTYTYDYDTEASRAVTDISSATSTISTTWLSLVVTIVILAIVLGIVLTSFSPGMFKRR